MFIKVFGVEIKSITDLRVAIALEKIRQLEPNISDSCFTKFMNELSEVDGVEELTETEIQDEFLQYVKEVNRNV